MKSFTCILSSLLLSLALVACGKKAEIEDKNKKSNLGPTSENIYFNALTKLVDAIKVNDAVTFIRTVQQNPSIDLNETHRHNGETFLIMAIKSDFREIRNFLIERGANLEKPTVDGETPLMAAVGKNRVNSVKVLLDRKVDVNKRKTTYFGDTALHIALKSSNDEIALLLLKNGAKVELTDIYGHDALALAQTYRLPKSLEFIHSVLKTGPEITVFQNLLLEADHRRLKTLLDRHPNLPSESAYESINPLAILVEAKAEKDAMVSAELLIQHKANVNGPLGADMTPLIKATINQKKAFAELYLSNEANPQLLDKGGKSALIHAIELNNAGLVELLLNESAVEIYTFHDKNGKRITFNACSVAKKMSKKLSTIEEKERNETIKKLLKCGFFRWLF
ncbi:MAG: ankyrin repeat domain-containing protein [Bacteriovoracia bacterium]